MPCKPIKLPGFSNDATLQPHRLVALLFPIDSHSALNSPRLFPGMLVIEDSLEHMDPMQIDTVETQPLLVQAFGSEAASSAPELSVYPEPDLQDGDVIMSPAMDENEQCPPGDSLPQDAADLPSGDLPVSDLPNGDLPAADLPNGDLPAADLPMGDLPKTDSSSAPSVGPFLESSEIPVPGCRLIFNCTSLVVINDPCSLSWF